MKTSRMEQWPPVWCADILVDVPPSGKQHECAGAGGPGNALGNHLWDAEESSVSLSGARNEAVLFQLVTEKRAGTLESVRLCSEGALKPELALWANISVPRAGRYYDDPLCPVEPTELGAMPAALRRILRIPGRERQGWTVELYIPHGAPAGEHALDLLLRFGGHQEARLKVRMCVLDFELPPEPGCSADMNAYGIGLGRGWPGLDPLSKRYRNIEREFFRTCHAHSSLFHLLPYSHSGRQETAFAPVLEGRGRARRVKDWAPFDKRWGAYLDGSAFSGTRRGATPISHFYLPVNLNWPACFEKYGTPGYELEFTNVLREFAIHCAERGWSRTKFEVFFNHKARWKYYPWDMDEIRFESDNKATLHLAGLARKAVADIPGVQFINRIDSSWVFDKSARGPLADAIELWIVNGSFLAPFPDEAERLIKKGQSVWFYGGAGQIAEPTRLHNLHWPWLAWGRGVQGFTWWNAVGWAQGDPFEAPGRGWDFCLYPGGRFGIDGPLPTLRFKAMYRGMQDHAYLQALSDRTGSRRAADSVLSRCLGCSRGREDWWQRGEYPGLSGSEIRAHTFKPRPWHSAGVAAWAATRAALGRAIEKRNG